jgi:phosphatidate phosphatase PAH1
MNTFGKLVSSVSDALDFNQATLSGCVDIIVVEQADGSLKCTPFHARFGKLKILKSKDKIVKIHVNNCEANFAMKLGSAGEAFFENDVHQIVKVDKSSQNMEEEPLILPDVEASQMEAVREGAKQKTLVEMLKLKHTRSNQSTSANSKSSGAQISDEAYNEDCNMKSSRKIKVKTLRPSSDNLKSLNLKYGANTITYTVHSTLQGAQTIAGFIYFWPKDANIIISDVDGTITKTDFLGHVLPMFGKDWSQPGIASLFTNIRKSGYFILYLTSRPIGQSQQTKNFLQSVYQDGKLLPQGPLLMSPDRMLPSVKREIIYKRPELFKMAALKDLRSLFPADHNPFHAGFGNRETDAISYRSVGIPLEKVFIVDPTGDIQHHKITSKKSYTIIDTMVHEVFPGILKSQKCRLAESLCQANVLTLENKMEIEENTVKVVG